MCIAEPIKLSLNSLATHPPIEKRLSAIMPGWRSFKEQKDQEAEREARRSVQEAIREEARQQSQTQQKGFDIGGLADTVGKPTTMHMHAAGALLLALPEVITQAAHGHHSNSHAMHLVFALLLSDHGQVEEASLQAIEKVYGAQSSERILELASHITKDQRQLRLAILDLAIPSLRRLSNEERKQFFGLLRQLIHQDNHVSQFEYVLYCLIHKHLIGNGDQSNKSITRFTKVEKELQSLLSAVIHASGQDQATKEKVFKQVFSGFISSERTLLAENFDAEQFHQALKTLRRLSPMLKKPLLNGLEEAIEQDGVVKYQEIELLRAIAECLDCPIPPIIENSQQEVLASVQK